MVLLFSLCKTAETFTYGFKNSGSKIYRFDGFGRRITTALFRISQSSRSVTIAAALTIGLAVSGTAALAADGGGRPEPELQRVALGAGGAVATTHPAATRAGIEILRRGGNAVDAAVAAAAVSGLTDPGNNGPGGLSYMTIYLSHQQRAVVIGDRAPAPAAFGPDDRKGLVGTGTLSVGVPTAVMVWEQALERYGTISLRRALQPAITSNRELYFDEKLEPYPVGSIFRNPDLARTYEMIAKGGAAAFYRGPIARAIVD